MAKQSKLAGALAKDPQRGRVSIMPVGKPQPQNLQRVSPGVYRNAQGGLVNSRGGSLPGQRPQQQQRPPMNVPAPNPNQNTGQAGPYDRYQPLPTSPNMMYQNNYPNMNPGDNLSNMQQPMNDLMYRYPQGQVPDFGAMFRYFEQQRQQPNTVSGMLQQGGQQQPMQTLVAEQPQNAQQPQQAQAPNPYLRQY